MCWITYRKLTYASPFPPERALGRLSRVAITPFLPLFENVTFQPIAPKAGKSRFKLLIGSNTGNRETALIIFGEIEPLQTGSRISLRFKAKLVELIWLVFFGALFLFYFFSLFLSAYQNAFHWFVLLMFVFFGLILGLLFFDFRQNYLHAVTVFEKTVKAKRVNKV